MQGLHQHVACTIWERSEDHWISVWQSPKRLYERVIAWSDRSYAQVIGTFTFWIVRFSQTESLQFHTAILTVKTLRAPYVAVVHTVRVASMLSCQTTERTSPVGHMDVGQHESNATSINTQMHDDVLQPQRRYQAVGPSAQAFTSPVRLCRMQ